MVLCVMDTAQSPLEIIRLIIHDEEASGMVEKKMPFDHQWQNQ